MSDISRKEKEIIRTRSINHPPCICTTSSNSLGLNAILTTFLNDAMVSERGRPRGGRKRSQLEVYLLNQMRLNYRYMHHFTHICSTVTYMDKDEYKILAFWFHSIEHVLCNSTIEYFSWMLYYWGHIQCIPLALVRSTDVGHTDYEVIFWRN